MGFHKVPAESGPGERAPASPRFPLMLHVMFPKGFTAFKTRCLLDLGLCPALATSVSCGLQDATSPWGLGQARRRVWMDPRCSEHGKSLRRGYFILRGRSSRKSPEWFEANIKLLQRTGVKSSGLEEPGDLRASRQHANHPRLPDKPFNHRQRTEKGKNPKFYL